MATVTLPGAGKDFVNITTGTDDSVVLRDAIKSLFTAAKDNFTAVTVPSGIGGTDGFFNLVFNDGAAKVSASAGANVQAVIDNGTGVNDTLTGGAQTTVLVGNAKGATFNTANNDVTVFGGAGNDIVNVSGSAVAYLEGGKNLVNLNGGDSISLVSKTAGTDTVNITGGKNTVQSGHAVTVDISGDNSTDTLTLATASKVSISGDKGNISLNSANAVVSVSGSADSVKIDGTSTVDLSGTSAKVTMAGGNVSISAGTSDAITASATLHVTVSGARSSDTISLGANSTISLGTSDTLNLGTSKGSAVITAKGSATIISSGAGGIKFTGAANAKDSIQAGQGAATLTAGKGASDKFIAGSGTNYSFLHATTGGGKDTFIGGAHNDTMMGAGTDKTHTDLFMFESSLKGGVHTITNFLSGKDTIDLVGYKSQVAAVIKAGAKTFNAKTGTETLTLSDHTKITVSGLHAALTTKDVIGS